MYVKLNNPFLEGYLTALYDFAHWHDGILQVGSTGKTYNEAEMEAYHAYGSPEEFQNYKVGRKSKA